MPEHCIPAFTTRALACIGANYILMRPIRLLSLWRRSGMLFMRGIKRLSTYTNTYVPSYAIFLIFCI